MALLLVARDTVEAERMEEREAHDTAARLWFDDPRVVGVVVVSDHDVEVARYERPNVVMPAGWPPKDARYVGRDPIPPIDPVRAGEVPRVARVAPPPPPPSCGSCATPLPPEGCHEGDVDQTPCGRLDRYRCPECGAHHPELTRVQLESRYLAARREAVHFVEPRPRPTAPAIPPRAPGYWRS